MSFSMELDSRIWTNSHRPVNRDTDLEFHPVVERMLDCFQKRIEWLDEQIKNL